MRRYGQFLFNHHYPAQNTQSWHILSHMKCQQMLCFLGKRFKVTWNSFWPHVGEQNWFFYLDLYEPRQPAWCQRTRIWWLHFMSFFVFVSRWHPISLQTWRICNRQAALLFSINLPVVCTWMVHFRAFSWRYQWMCISRGVNLHQLWLSRGTGEPTFLNLSSLIYLPDYTEMCGEGDSCL